MPRTARHAPGGLVFHVLNRAVARHAFFKKAADYQAFERVFAEALEKHPIRVLSYCLMPNHWHLVLWPSREGQLTDFVRWLTHTHTMRWHAHYHTSGTGHLYQGRFKSFPIEADDHLYGVLRYVERNALRANLVQEAEAWKWSSLYLRETADPRATAWLHPWPVAMPKNWVALVNEPQTEGELKAVRRSVVRGCPYGSAPWQARTARRLGLDATLRPRGRPKKPPDVGVANAAEGPTADRK
jgi:putative transposase